MKEKQIVCTDVWRGDWLCPQETDVLLTNGEVKSGATGSDVLQTRVRTSLTWGQTLHGNAANDTDQLPPHRVLHPHPRWARENHFPTQPRQIPKTDVTEVSLEKVTGDIFSLEVYDLTFVHFIKLRYLLNCDTCRIAIQAN